LILYNYIQYRGWGGGWGWGWGWGGAQAGGATQAPAARPTHTLSG